jgi:hypothetical protein
MERGRRPLPGFPAVVPGRGLQGVLAEELAAVADREKAAYQRAIDFGDPDTAPMAVELLTDLENRELPGRLLILG